MVFGTIFASYFNIAIISKLYYNIIMKDKIEEYLATLQIKENTKNTYRNILITFVSYLHKEGIYRLKDVNDSILTGYLSFLENKNANYSIATYIYCAIRFLKYFGNKSTWIETRYSRTKAGQPSQDDVAYVMNSVMTGTGLTETQKKYTARTQMRDESILRLIIYYTFSAQQISDLDIGDYDMNYGFLRKGDSVIQLKGDMNSLMQEYVFFEKWQAADMSLFTNRNGTRISVRSIQRLVKKYSGECIGKKITPYSLANRRRSIDE